jgi:mannose-6-phosphate isomerase-like protein (cupin superfamily)
VTKTPRSTEPRSSIVPLDGLPHTRHSHEFVGADHGDVPFSIILVHSCPGAGPAIHTHPYAEVFVVDFGQATFVLGDETLVVEAGHVVIGAPDVPHGFTNTGTGELRLTAIHGNPRFITRWLENRDEEWASPPEP